MLLDRITISRSLSLVHHDRVFGVDHHPIRRCATDTEDVVVVVVDGDQTIVTSATTANAVTGGTRQVVRYYLPKVVSV